MKYTKLGNSDLMVSRICLGCMGFGDSQSGQHTWTLDEDHSREIINGLWTRELIFSIPQPLIRAVPVSSMWDGRCGIMLSGIR